MEISKEIGLASAIFVVPFRDNAERDRSGDRLRALFEDQE